MGASASASMFAPHLLEMETEKLRFRFGMFSDIYYANYEPVGNRFYWQSSAKSHRLAKSGKT
jgi:hypothetical protein